MGPGAAAGALGAASAAAWLAAHRRDRRAVERDPEYRLLFEAPRGQELAVRSGDGTEVHVELFGDEDAPPIVLVHGWTCALRFWTHQLRDLSSSNRLIAYDLRGHGRSEAPRGWDFSSRALADDLQAVLEATLAGGERALLVGHSLGAMSILAWAGRHPDSVVKHAAAAALVNTGFGDLVSESLVLRVPSALGRARAAVGAVVLGASAPLPPASPITYRAVRHVALSPSATPAQVAFCQELVLACRRDVRAGCGRELTKLDLANALEHLTVPTAVIAGEDDRLTPLSHARRLARLLPDSAGVVELDRVGHMAPVEAHPQVNAAVRELADRVMSSRAAAAM